MVKKKKKVKEKKKRLKQTCQTTLFSFHQEKQQILYFHNNLYAYVNIDSIFNVIRNHFINSIKYQQSVF